MKNNILITDKSQLSTLVFENLPKFELVNKYLGKAIINLFKSADLMELLEIPLVRYLAISDVAIQNFENYLKERSFLDIQNPVSRLQSNLRVEYPAVLAELESAKRLKGEGKKEIKFLPTNDNPDLQYEDNGIIRYAEVKSLMVINPEFSVLNDKLEAKSMVSSLFQRSFTIECEYDFNEYTSVEQFHLDVNKSVDRLIKLLETMLSNSGFEETFVIDPITFHVSSQVGRAGYFLMLSGGLLVFGTPKDVFLDFNTVYVRFLVQIKKAYQQLLKKRSGDSLSVQKDRVYIFLNIGRYGHFIPKEAKKIFRDIAKATGITELVDLRIEL